MGAFIPNVDLTVLKKFFGGVEGLGSFVVGDTISPILEIQDIALFQRRETLTKLVATISVVNQAVDFTVDAGEFWLIHFLSVTTDVLDADQTVIVQLFVRPPGTSPFGRLLVPSSIGNNEQGGIGAAFGRPLILPSGARFGAVSNQITGGVAGNVKFDLLANIHRVNT